VDNKILTVEHVMRCKGTQLIGKLECDVKVNDQVNIKNNTVRIFAILKGMSQDLQDFASKGDHVVLMFRNIPHVPISPGDEVLTAPNT
jgi:hypothetical protein